MSVSNNGTNGNYLRASTSMPSFLTDWTFCFWAALDLQASPEQTLVALEESIAPIYIFVPSSTRAVTYACTTGNTSFPGGDFTDGQSTFYAVTHDAAGTTTTLYRGANGGALTTTAITQNIPALPTDITVFNELADAFPTNGAILGFGIWTVALSAKEVTNQYLRLSPVSQVTAELDRWVPIVDSANPGEAYVGRGKNLTLTGTLSASRRMPSIPWSQPMILM